MTRAPLLEIALTTAGRGWRVFPLAPGHKTPRRQLTSWETKATTDPARIERWWAHHPTDNVGVACGPSGLVVVDLDTAKPGDKPPKRWASATSGADVLTQLANEHPAEIAPTWTVATPSGGRHLYYRPPPDRQLRNTAGRIGWHIDTRAHGGYVVAAGSIVAGHAYELVNDTDPIALPAWLLDLATPPAPTPPQLRPHPTTRPTPRARRYVETALTAELQAVLDAPAGRRNDTLNRAAWNLARLARDGVIAPDVIETALQAAGEATGLDPREVTATIRSALAARARPARQPAPGYPTSPEIRPTGHTAPARQPREAPAP